MECQNISVIIPTHNRAKELSLVLPSYMVSKRIKEIIIINNGSTNETSDVIEAFRKNSSLIREIRVNQKLSAQKSRMLGISEAYTDYILIGEDDVYLSPDYVDILYNQLKEYSCDIIGGKLIPIKINSPSELFNIHNDTISNFIGFPQDFRPFNFYEKLKASKPAEVPLIHAIVLLKKSIFNNVSFDPWYSGNGFREETDFFLSARKFGAKIFFTPDTFCYHLRGSMSARGGQRINRLLVEFWSIYNTWYMLKKHWDILSNDFRLKYGILFTTLLYFIHRECAYLLRVIKRQY